MGRLPKKPNLQYECKRLGIKYTDRMSIGELEKLISDYNEANTDKPKQSTRKGRPSKKELLIKKFKETYPDKSVNGFDDLTVEQIERKFKEIEESMMSPYDYFQSVKEAVKEINKEEISKMYEAASSLMDKYKETGQEKAEKRLAFHVKTLLKESKIIDKGITKFVQKDDITNYIDHISKKPVKIIEMKNYPREIPDELISVIKDTKDIFDEFYIVFTDYSEGELAKEVEKERDPILFGGFCTSSRDIVAERFYYLGDWEDEYCDLTLDKLIKETSKDIVKDVSIPKNRDELIGQLGAYEEKNEKMYYTKPKKPPFFKRVFNALFRNND